MLISADELRRIFDYDPETGHFTWVVKTHPKVTIGKIAGRRDRKGYIEIKVHNRFYRAHRLAWLYVYGEWPRDQIDHINGVRDDNRISNLREATSAQNCSNKGMSKNNTSGFKGVSWYKPTSKWGARIRDKHLGYFDLMRVLHFNHVKNKQAR